MELLSFAKTQLEAQTDLDVRTFYSTDTKRIYSYLPNMRPDLKSLAILAYPHAIRKKEPQTIYAFYVYVIVKDWGSLDTALTRNQATLEKVYSALDYQVYPVDSSVHPFGSSAVFRADKDDGEAMSIWSNQFDENGKNTVFRCEFFIEDN